MGEVQLLSKKGQVTIFVILAIVIVVAGGAIYYFYPEISSTSTSLEENPKVYIQNCVEGVLEENAEILGIQGGSFVPDSSFTYLGDSVEYLCYTNQYYETCVVQRTSLVSHIEEELKESLTQKVDECFSEMESSYRSRGYGVNLEKGNFVVQLLPEKIILTSNSKLDLTKGSTQEYEFFDVVLDNNLYELASIARSMVAWEVEYGDLNPILYMNYYPHLKVEKMLQSDGTKIYIITDRDSGNKFQFASRSVVWPPGVPTPGQ